MDKTNSGGSPGETIQAVNLAQIEVADVFGDLSQFQDTAAAAVEGVKRALTRVPLTRAQGDRRNPGSFVRVHPTFEVTGVGLIRDPRAGDTYIVMGKEMVKLLAKWLQAADLHVAITREGLGQGHWPVHLWPVPASAADATGKINPFLQTHRLIAQNAKIRWLRMINIGGQYEEEGPEDPKVMPSIDWSEMPWSFSDILAKAFPPSTHVILNDQHPLVSYLLGRT